MEKVGTLKNYLKDEFIPEPKQIPKRIKKEIILDLEENACPFCGKPLRYYYLSKERMLVTLKYDIELRVVYKRCINEKCIACVSKRKFYNDSLDLHALPKKKFALDVTFLIGYLIYQQDYTEVGVVTYLWEEHGIVISQTSVNCYKRISQALGEVLLAENADKIKRNLDKLPLRVYSIDGLTSNKSKTLFVIRDLISGIVLASALIEAHDTETMHDFMEKVFHTFGTPDAMVGDGERGLIGAVRKYYSHIPYQYCQRHFLDNLGKALMEDLYKASKKNSLERAL